MSSPTARIEGGNAPPMLKRALAGGMRPAFGRVKAAKAAADMHHALDIALGFGRVGEWEPVK